MGSRLSPKTRATAQKCKMFTLLNHFSSHPQSIARSLTHSFTHSLTHSLTSNDDNNPLGRISHTGSDSTRLLDGQRGQLVVEVPIQSTSNQVETNDGVGLPQLGELPPARSLLDDEEGDGHGEGQHGGDGEKVANVADTVFQSVRLLSRIIFNGAGGEGGGGERASQKMSILLI